jgi:AhpD family alkylhydroperoxidase
MSLMREIEWEACLLEPASSPEFERRFRKETGFSNRDVRYFAGVPWLEDAEIAFNRNGLLVRVVLDSELGDLAGMAVSQDNSCRYCFAMTRAFLRHNGMPERRIASLEQDMLTAEFNPAERSAIEFARRLSRSNPLVTPADLEPLREHGFEELAIRELCAQVLVHMFYNRVSTLCALPPQRVERLPDRWWIKLMRPILGRIVSRYERRSPRVPLRPDQRKGPFSEIVVALDGLPAAGALRAAIDGMLASPVLARRAKGLMIAVVARSLGCSYSDAQARQILREEGLEGAALEEILAHLASPALDPVETRLVPFARETVWYQPATLQRKARSLCESLARAELIETAGVVALANGLGRLGFLAQLDE